MEWRKGRRSDNVVDARGEGGGGGMRFGGGKGLGLGAVLLIVGIGGLTGQDPLQILGQLAGQMEQQQQQVPSGAGGKAPPANDQQAEFVASILGDTEDTWKALFAEGGKQYRDPKLVLF
uniref:neutral zinc metallopeptidase n=1 Tax=Pseudomonas sp. 79_C TaxID=2813567 RepID=UPI001A9EA3D1